MTPHQQSFFSRIDQQRRFWLKIGAASVMSTMSTPPAWALPTISRETNEGDVAHLLQRTSIGIAPGDMRRIRAQGVEGYLQEQLNPHPLSLPIELQTAISKLSTLQASTKDLITRFRDLNPQKNANDTRSKERQHFQQQVLLEAQTARIWHALYSPWQLQEVMVDFWFNHFNVYSGKNVVRVLVGTYERDAIRPHALGSFKNLLKATARHPAMLFYLDNWLSVGSDDSTPMRQNRQNAQKKSGRGLNENYAREVMELHTLGVDGGYSQKDVTELARILTGWTINPQKTSDTSGFYFDDRRHDHGSKSWLGRQFSAQPSLNPDSGLAEGDAALDVLASHPQTAQHISYKLVQYFVADQPPPALVNELARTFLKTAGDIRQVLYTLFTSPIFWNPSYRQSKFKSPYRFVLSALRSSGVTSESVVTHVKPLLNAMNGLGMPLFGCPTPDGYKNTQVAWLNPEALTRRIAYASALSSGQMPLFKPMDSEEMTNNTASSDSSANTKTFSPQSENLLITLSASLSTKTKEAVQASPPKLRAALLLGSPDFMHY